MGVPERRSAARCRVPLSVAYRSPDLHDALRLYCLAGFALLQAEVDRGSDVPFAFEEHEARGRTTFYEFRPLILSFVETRSTSAWSSAKPARQYRRRASCRSGDR